MDEIAVLVLNYTFEPLHFTNARRAITLLLAGKAEAVERVALVAVEALALHHVADAGLVPFREPFPVLRSQGVMHAPPDAAGGDGRVATLRIYVAGRRDAFDHPAIAKRGLKYERLDQLTIDLILGAR